MKPQELVILASELSTRQERYGLGDRNMESIGILLDQAEPILDQLESGRFQESDKGYITFSVLKESDEYIIYPTFVDCEGKKAQLGQIGKCHSGNQGWADSFYKLDGSQSDWEDSEPIYPGDPRWEAIVEPLEKAIKTINGEQDQTPEKPNPHDTLMVHVILPEQLNQNWLDQFNHRYANKGFEMGVVTESWLEQPKSGDVGSAYYEHSELMGEDGWKQMIIGDIGIAASTNLPNEPDITEVVALRNARLLHSVGEEEVLADGRQILVRFDRILTNPTITQKH